MARIAIVVTLALVAWLAAGATNALVSLALVVDTPARARAAAPPSPTRIDRGCEILARNIFDQRGALPCEERTPTSTVTAATPSAPAECTEGLRLVATYLDRDAPLAMIARPTGPTELVTIGTTIEPGTIEHIEREHLVLERDGTRCLLSMFASRATTTLARTAATPEPIAGARLLDDRIELDRSALDRLVSEPAFARLRAMPAPTRDGRLAVRVLGIGRDHPLAALGLRSGDLLTSIDARPLDGPDAWLEAMTRARSPGRHVVVVERGGERREIVVDLLDR
ncbi:type II secretion system protein N [Sandaracinus amylolyticus]|uniref:General secretion pathway protein C n=1 Tax=Sandaracinus amylolyticus TaxID=927083 RepID=A0A0F6W829_9BACT|nr:type II secretion system protein N [Sandaracinus amylolyticus]AKF09727.1 hypothetical protein DB32_006876 [Sandaracinus amylolyticus]